MKANLQLILLTFILAFISTSCSTHKKVKDVTVKSNGIELYGSLTYSKNIPKKENVVLIIAGSGPTDRDGNNLAMINNSLKYLAEELAQQGISSLRYDKRGIGASADSSIKEENIVFDDFVADAKTWINYLKQKNFKKIIVLGHSEGALIGAKASLNNKDVDKFISLAGMGYKPAELLKTQLEKQGEFIKKIAFPIIDSLEMGEKVDSVPILLQSAFRPSAQNFIISLFKNDPVEIYRDLNMPILIVQGTTDLQISINDALRLAKSNDLADLQIIDSMNHVLKKVELNFFKNMATYKNSDLPIHPGLIEVINKFLKD